MRFDQRPRQHRWTRPVGWRASMAFGLALMLALLSGVELDVPPDLLSYERTTSTRFVTEDGTLIHERPSAAGGLGRPVELQAVSPFVVSATLAGEDAHFYWHPGVDPVGVMRAIWLNAREGRFAYGGSSITQQLAKLIQREPRNVGGKLRESLLAVRLEHSLTKDQILAQYLNRAYYGRNATGIEAASQRFFGKSARELDLDQAALLAALPRAPTAYDPARHEVRARARRAHLLDLMVKRGSITPQLATEAAARPIVLGEPGTQPRSRHAVDRLLVEVKRTGEVTTSLDLDLERRLRAQLEGHLRRIRTEGAEQAAILVLRNHDARVVAMVGSRDYSDVAANGAVNGATSRRSAGSTLKPFLYALAFERGRSSNSTILDQPTIWKDYQPRAVSGEYQGWVSYERALGSSLNVPAVALLDEIGVPEFATRLSRLGFRAVDASGARHGLSLSLGAVPVSLVELAGAYAALANEGIWRAPSLVETGASERMFRAESAREVTRILSSPRARRPEFGLETPLDLPFEVAAKTGTSSAYSDNWTVGYTKHVTVAVWVGNFDGKPLRGTLAMDGAAPLFHDAMFEAMRDRVPAPLVAEAESPPPEGESHPAAASFELTSPRKDARIVVDPLLPQATQRLALRVSSHGLDPARLSFQIDDRQTVVTHPDQPPSIPLVAGRHRVIARAYDADGALLRESHPVHFIVTERTHAPIAID